MAHQGPPEPDFDVALSFAGEDRPYVDRVAALLRGRGIKVFYDEFMIAEMWGEDLFSYLDGVFRRRAKFAVVFVSEHYARKAWTNHERQSVQARALAEQNAYLLPVRLDDSELPGLRPTVGHVDARVISPEALVDLIQRKLVPAATGVLPVRFGVPRGVGQRRELIAARPPAWEYLLFAGVLWDGKQALEPKYRDHELRYAPRNGVVLGSDSEAKAYILRSSTMAAAELPRVESLMSRSSQDWAFGAPGVAGNPERIVHLGTRLVDFYEYLLDWAAALRGSIPPEEFRRIFELVACYADLPIWRIREFIDRYIQKIGPVPEQLDRGETLHLTLELVLEVDPNVSKAFDREVKRLRRKKRW